MKDNLLDFSVHVGFYCFNNRLLMQMKKGLLEIVIMTVFCKYTSKWLPNLYTKLANKSAHKPHARMQSISTQMYGASAIYNFAPFSLLASRSLSLNSLLKIFPLGLLGITSMNSTPPFNHLCLLL